MSVDNAMGINDCCSGEKIPLHRVKVAASSLDGSIYRRSVKLTPAVVNYKALVYYFGKQGEYSVKRVGLLGSTSRIGQAAQSIGSYALPGNISPYRSPVRSAVFGALIPGSPGGRGVRGPRRKTYRCPEGYQYGGRFTDNRLSTCGQKLFDIPSPLGMIIGAIRRLAREVSRAGVVPVVGTPLGGGEYSDPLDSRRPQIPRVAERNERIMQENIARLISEMGKPGVSATRMVRRDGFILEPVVSPRVLRSVPDNRDMEGATFMLTANKLPDLGQDELGLLSNTGINQVLYVLPGGSTLSLRKRRELSIGERRKLGRTVNSAISVDNTKNPTAKIQYVANETGDGIEYSENFIGIKNPHEVVKAGNGKSTERWVSELFGKRKLKPKSESRASSSTEAARKKIASIDEAAEHLAAGGALSDIDPMILAEALTKANLFKRESLANGIEKIVAPDKRDYVLYQPRKQFEHINAVFSSDFQQHLGIESPDVSPVGEGDRRPYIVESITTAYPGLVPSTDKVLVNASSSSIAKMMVADFITGVENRSPSTVDLLEIGDEIVAVPIFNDSNLAALADIKIRERTAKLIDEFKALQETGIYGQYYRDLKERQRREILGEIQKLIDRARLFNYVHFLQRLSIDGRLSDAEKRHIKIVQRISEQRVGILESVLEVVSDILKAK